MQRAIIKEEDYQALPPTLKDPSRFCRVLRRQKPVSTSCLKLKFRVSKLK